MYEQRLCGVVRVGSLPRHPDGKILKRELRVQNPSPVAMPGATR